MLTDDEIVKAASEGRLSNKHDDTKSWFEIDGEHTLQMNDILRLARKGRIDSHLDGRITASQN